MNFFSISMDVFCTQIQWTQVQSNLGSDERRQTGKCTRVILSKNDRIKCKLLNIGVPNMTAPKRSNWDWYEWDAWTRVWTDMTETWNQPLTRIWLRHLGPNLHRYYWDGLKILFLHFDFTYLRLCRNKNYRWNFFGRLGNICASSGRCVSVI